MFSTKLVPRIDLGHGWGYGMVLGEVRFKKKPEGDAYLFDIQGRSLCYPFDSLLTNNPYEALLVEEDCPEEVIKELTSRIW